MSVEVRPSVMRLYNGEKIKEARESLTLKTRQLRLCESQLSTVNDRIGVLRALIDSECADDIRTAALEEWQRAKEDVLKLNGKSAKLHKEITHLRDGIARWRKLRDWSHGS